MISDEKKLIQDIVDRYVQTGVASDEQVKVVFLEGNKTTIVEPGGSGGRSVMLDKFRSGERIVWAAFSSHSQTVYLSDDRG